ncbi:unnamed protein product [Ectocarpus sp. 4 AP-2014]
MHRIRRKKNPSNNPVRHRMYGALGLVAVSHTYNQDSNQPTLASVFPSLQFRRTQLLCLVGFVRCDNRPLHIGGATRGRLALPSKSNSLRINSACGKMYLYFSLKVLISLIAQTNQTSYALLALFLVVRTLGRYTTHHGTGNHKG